MIKLTIIDILGEPNSIFDVKTELIKLLKVYQL